MSVENGLSLDPGRIEAKKLDPEGRSRVEREFGGLGLALIIAVALTAPEEAGNQRTIITSSHVLRSLGRDDISQDALDAMLGSSGFEEVPIQEIIGDGRQRNVWDDFDPDTDGRLWRRKAENGETWRTPDGAPSFQTEQAERLRTEHDMECPTNLGYDFGFDFGELTPDDDPKLVPYTKEAAEQLDVDADKKRTLYWGYDDEVGPPPAGSDRTERIQISPIIY
ncbi:MAG TPA: hypothetical protein PKG71_04470 [Candidatus Woesebacteria bacterium]|nr:hypothetical protein [Candidatus Woesebacteria bacterium]HNS95191.1 hypothetical protein [Candidatus Woesebacteria bacterium]